MTLRHRLLLVYLIVVFLSVATVGVAVYELSRTQAIYGPFLLWHDVVWDSQRLRMVFLSMSDGTRREGEFESLLTGVQQKIGSVSNYLDVDYIRDWYIIRLRQAYQAWKEAPPEAQAETARQVSERLDDLADAVESVRGRLNDAAEQQRTNKWVLVGVVLGLAVLHVVVIGWLLRLWLLRPMERLNRQVSALGRDQPPPEPLLTAPLELAALAAALDKARQSLQVYRQQIIDSERLTTIGQFAAQLAHNLRNPLASIRAAAQVTARHERGNSYVGERMDDVVASVDRLNHWIGGLMEVARREPTPTRNIDVVPVLQRIAEALRPELSAKEIPLGIVAPPEGVVCRHDPATLEQALVAMVVNAIEASPLGRGITLRVERLARANGDDSNGHRHKDAPLRPHCRISVEDAGPGLPVDDPERIFEFSYSTKQRGMGLGLALARLALERQGGEAHARNHAEGGAVVYVDLPIDEKGVPGDAGSCPAGNER